MKKEILKYSVVLVFTVLAVSPLIVISQGTLYDSVCGRILAFLAIDRVRSWIDRLYNYLTQ